MGKSGKLAKKRKRELDEALTRRQYGYASVDDYYAAASSDQRLQSITTPLLPRTWPLRSSAPSASRIQL